MNQVGHYQDAITNLTSDEIDYKKTCISIARTNPGVFNNGFYDVYGAPEEVLKIAGHNITRTQLDQVLEELKQGKFIQTIKVLRSLTGLGLKEAKDICDELKLRHGTGQTFVD